MVSFASIFSLIRRWAGVSAAKKAMRLLRDAFTLVVCDSLVINQAIDSEQSDFEDAVQYFSAVRAGADCILSRNPRDFPRRPVVPVLSPTDFLAQLEME